MSENKLHLEISLYLKQHAENPIHWWAYGEQPLNKAKELKEGRIFIFPNIQLIEPDCFSHKLAIRASDLHIISSIFIDNAIKSISKESWGMFWRLYNLTQSKTIIHSPTHELDS